MASLLVIALLMGMLVPVQTAANARMRISVGPAFVVTLVSFTVSLAMLLVVSAAGGIPIVPTAALFTAAPWWSWMGGIIALFTITVSIYLFRVLGQLQTTVLPLLGQLLFSLVIDHFGLFGSVRIPLSGMRLLAMAILIAGMLLVVVFPNTGNWGQGGSTYNVRTLLWQITGIAAGCLMASIGAIYGTLGVLLGSAIQATTLSFLIATCVIILVCSVSGQIRYVRKAFVRGNPWWMWLGGPFGAVAVFGNAWVIPRLGAGAFFMSLLLGQMILSLLMEECGWLGATRKRITVVQIAGIVLMLAGVALIRL